MKMMLYDEEDFLLLSGIQHFAFCRRQWALIHIEQQWQENLYTIEGELLHKKAHDGCSSEKRNDLIISRGMPVHSRELGTSGICDIVEFHLSKEGINLFGRKGQYIVYPVEYKKGKPKKTDIDVVQLVAQAMCLEEMLVCNIEAGAIFYGDINHRENIFITDDLRDRVRSLFSEMHEMYQRRYTPKVKKSKQCTSCSVRELCLPQILKKRSSKEYIQKYLKELDD